MSKLPVISGQDAIRAFAKMGYIKDHQTGSHIILRQQGPPHRRLTVPNHKELAPAAGNEPDRPGAALFTAGDMSRAGRSCRGAEGIRPPHLDRLAAESARLASVHAAQAVCPASRAAGMDPEPATDD